MPEEHIRKHRDTLLGLTTALKVVAWGCTIAGAGFGGFGLLLILNEESIPHGHSYGLLLLIFMIAALACLGALCGHRTAAVGQMHIGDAVGRENELLAQVGEETTALAQRMLALEEQMARLSHALAAIASAAPGDELARRRGGASR